MTAWHPLERALVVSLRWLVAGLVLSPLLLTVPIPSAEGTRLLLVTVHLGLLVAFGVALVVRLAPFAEGGWFAAASPRAARWGATSALVALDTGAVALLTLATSAALRYQPSLQFLQLLSALDIAWAGAALYLGVRMYGRRRTAVVVTAVLGVVCVWSIWNYLRVVGFAQDGGWLLDGRQLSRLVLPYDTMAAVAAVVTVALGVRRAAPQPTAQRSPQS